MANLEQLDNTVAHLDFISYKGFDVKSVNSLRNAKKWLETADADELLYGEPAGDPFDIMMGNMRRGMLIKTVENEIKRMNSKRRKSND